jgi:oligopeptide transport system permease protein
MANLQSAYGLDQPMWVQYGRYLRALAHGDFGPSFKYKDFTVTELIGQGFPVTLELGAIALGLALVWEFPSGTSRRSIITRGGLRRDVAGRGRVRHTDLRGAAFSGSCCSASTCTGCRWRGGNPGRFAIWCCPSSRLTLPPLAYIARLTRGSMLEVLAQPFIRTALRQRSAAACVILRHALRPALLPVAGYWRPRWPPS